MARRKKKVKSSKKSGKRITQVGATDEVLTDRAGLAPFVNFVHNSKIAGWLARTFDNFRLSKKGIGLDDSFLQILSFFADGTSPHLAHFDQLKDDEAYQRVVGCDKMLSTAQLKRLLAKANVGQFHHIRPMIQQTALSAMKEENPDVVVLFLDSTVFDNNDAKCRQGCKPTYKKVLGYHPQNLVWNGMLLDTIFRRGDKHSNHGDEVRQIITNATTKIRLVLGDDVPIIFLTDSGYYDQKNFDTCDELGVGFICSGRRHNDLQALQQMHNEEMVESLANNSCRWKFCEFMEKRGCWEKAYRGFYMRLFEKDGDTQLGMEDRTVVTNIGPESAIGQKLIAAGKEDYLSGRKIIRLDHSRGAGELTFRNYKEFQCEKMPCLDFFSNALWYYLGALAFNLFTLFKRKVLFDLFGKDAYPRTIRRQLFDMAGRVCHSSKTFTLRITERNMKRLKFDKIWRRSNEPLNLLLI